jgi:hypothetical protein
MISFEEKGLNWRGILTPDWISEEKDTPDTDMKRGMPNL